MRERAVTDRTEIVLPRFLLQKRDQVGHGLDPEIGVHGERARHGDELRHRRDVLLRVVGQLREQQRIDCERSADRDTDGRTIRRGLGDRIGAGIAAGTGLVLDHECRAGIFRLQLLAQQAGDNIGGGTGAERHNDPDRFGGPALRLRLRERGEHYGNGQGDTRHRCPCRERPLSPAVMIPVPDRSAHVSRRAIVSARRFTTGTRQGTRLWTITVSRGRS